MTKKKVVLDPAVWTKALDEARDEVAALRERVSHDWWERAMVAERDLAEARAEIERLLTDRDTNWVTGVVHEEARALLARWVEWWDAPAAADEDLRAPREPTVAFLDQRRADECECPVEGHNPGCERDPLVRVRDEDRGAIGTDQNAKIPPPPGWEPGSLLPARDEAQACTCIGGPTHDHAPLCPQGERFPESFDARVKGGAR